MRGKKMKYKLAGLAYWLSGGLGSQAVALAVKIAQVLRTVRHKFLQTFPRNWEL